MVLRRRSRKTLLGALFAVLLVNAMVSPVAAVRHSYWTENFSVVTVAPAWIGHASYRAQWDTYTTRDAGRDWRIVKDPMLYVYIPLGRECLNAGVCASFTLDITTKWEVLSSSGAVLASVTSMPYSHCSWTFVYPSTAHLLGRCKASTWQLNISANRMRLTWRAAVTVNSGVTFFWPKITRTVAL